MYKPTEPTDTAEAVERLGLYSIGRLSKTAAISVDTLRYYDEIGLFKPAYTDGDTGYRYYSEGQAPGLARIIELKEYGFPLKEIKALLAADEKILMAAYQNRWWKLRQENFKTQRAMEKLSEKIKLNQEAFLMGKKILLVDDANFMRMMCRDILSNAGFEICGEADDGAQAVEVYKNNSPDLVLMDIVMPAMDGIYSMQKIREFDPDAKVVMLSAMAQARIVTEAFLSGAADFVVKPFYPQTVIGAISKAFTEERNYDRDILREIHARCKNDMEILSQEEIDKIKNAALSGDKAEQEAIIENLNTAQAQKEAESKDALNNYAEKNSAAFGNEKILPLLEKIAQGQDEMKELLKIRGL